LVSHYDAATSPIDWGSKESKLTKGAAAFGEVFELDAEPDALATGSSYGRNIALDIARQSSIGEEGLLGQSGLVFDTARIAGYDGGIFLCDTARHGERKDSQDPINSHFKDGQRITEITWYCKPCKSDAICEGENKRMKL
jgi:hypothetical protein